MSNIYQFSVENNKQETTDLTQFSDKVLLIVNTASKCGFTPQYQGLQTLHDTFQTKGFEVLAFPCNQFKHQESGSNEEIQQFCDLHFNIKFPLFNKIEVNGNNAHPLFNYLKQQAPGILGSTSIKWNFTKFLVNRQGEVVQRYAPTTKPEAITADIEKLLSVPLKTN
ncbi:glutathione peroxidase [Colwellia sp. MT41]|uniref:Glutathione peroxidase n=1 Tax=Colwellia marinimaniae TaxID=1513592 RepID=A0ABQ0MX20_9GAMM|nr:MULTISPECIES: glutathione peroxidase [Colwellia]ALO35155.1 glutathione peroxidase [Colwellia sp. MT41]GAW96932.1 glutathione peroxidase [Colwellia marinimaniae]